ncbi:MAG: hypothetical protein IIX99_00195 [Oscillospiraceae bacterium]|nr:hypothetical protein [Oscillospiraceae bacterium]
MDTIQYALKALYYSLGGSADNVRDMEDINELIFAISNLDIADKIKAAVELPALPESDGTYTLQVVIDDGAATFSWEAVSAE